MVLKKLLLLTIQITLVFAQDRVPLKIRPHYDDSIDSLPENYKNLIKDSLIAATVRWAEDSIKVDREPDDILRLERDCTGNILMIAPGNIQKCIRGCVGEQYCGTHKIPSTYFKQCLQIMGTAPENEGEGVSEGFILFVSVGTCTDMSAANTLVQANYCGQAETRTIRPTHGYMMFCEDELNDSISMYEEQVHRTLQGMLTILAFDQMLMRRFVDSSGDRYLLFVQSLNRDYDAADGPVSKAVDYIVLPTVKAEAKAHFDCEGVPGAQIESGTGDHVYFEKLFFHNELMAPGISKRGVISVFTWAVLQDSGWYDVSRDFTEPLIWGKNAGCSFILQFCYTRLSNDDYSSDKVEPFCVEPEHSQCTNDHRGFGMCDIKSFPDELPEEYRNFDKILAGDAWSKFDPDKTGSIGGSDDFSDRCPYHVPTKICADASAQPSLNIFGEEYSGMSRCFNYEVPWRSLKLNMDSHNMEMGGCYPVVCNKDSYTVRVNKNQYKCTSGAIIEVHNNIGNIEIIGTLACPAYDVMCASHTECTKDCSGNGKCVIKRFAEECVCYPGYQGEECQLSFGLRYCKEKPCKNNVDCIELDGTFECDCSSGRTGRFCDFDSACTATSCLNEGKCTEAEGAVFCECTAGFIGYKCETEIEKCTENMCQNEGVCYKDDSEMGFFCSCSYSYEGDYCESMKGCDIAGVLACQNGGLCVITPTRKYCQCFDGFTGPFCEVEMCSEMTCNYNGLCSMDEDGMVKCTCSEGFTGTRCGIRTTMPLPCEILEQCVVVDGDLVICSHGYGGSDCMASDYCLSNACSSHTMMCNAHDNGYECLCMKGWTGDFCELEHTETFSTGIGMTTTSPIPKSLPRPDYCDPNQCQNGANCISIAISMDFYCACADGWQGKTCATARGECYTEPCKNGGACTEEAGDADFACLCPEEWEGLTCEEPVDPCSLLDCLNGGACSSTQDIAVCQCPFGYGGDACEVKENYCYAEPCENKGECVYHSNDHTYTCICPSSHTGERCELELENSCILDNNCEYDSPCIGSLDDYTCDCPEGLTGERCQNNKNDCEGNPCQHHLFSFCTDRVGGYECECMDGFSWNDEQCVDINECTMDASNCIHGFCLNLPGKYKCMCKVGWKGTRCDKNFDECESHKCKNGAKCVDLIADYRCECVEGYTGIYCEEVPLPCDTKPCFQGALCRNIDETDFECTCPAGFVGKRCETNYDECATNPCGEHGKCIDGVNLASCQCDVGWGSSDCTIYTGHCLDGKSPCQNDALCVDLPGNEYECQCSEFFSGDYCETNIDDCAGAPCLNNGSCTDGLGTFTCACTAQWEGDTCAEDVNECEVSDPCLEGSRCLNNQGGFECECSAGFEGDLCDVNTDDCVVHECGNGGTCVDDIAGYNCQCTEDYKGVRCEVQVQKCQPDSCLNNGICSVIDNVINCACSETGFTGAQCEDEINECANVTCMHGGTCKDELEGFTCECHCSFTGVLCEEEIDFCSVDPCLQDSTCMSLPNTCEYRCLCSDGYEGKHCDDEIDACAPEPCVYGNCTDEAIGYSCECDEGYGGNNCDENLDMCRDEPCKNSATCITTISPLGELAFLCDCTEQYRGHTCEEKVPPCTISPCGDYGICQPEEEEEICVCDEGFEGDWCESNIDECAGEPCRNGGECQDGIAGYSCKCISGYGGKNCTNRKAPCSDTVDICKNDSVCEECAGDGCDARYTCTCAPGFEGQHCDVNIDDCADSPCQNEGECVDGLETFSCRCQQGYEGDLCETDIDECASQPCLHDSECVNDIGGYTCNCVGFTGKNCEDDIDECEENPCANGGLCENVDGSYSCECVPGFEGDHCEEVIIPCDSDPCQNFGSCENVDAVSYSCLCGGGYTGANCEIPSDGCAGYDCNDGTCQENDGGVVSCVCDDDHKGLQCELMKCKPGICQNNSTCIDTPVGIDCVCPLPYVGDTCEEMVAVLGFTSRSRAVIAMGEATESAVKLNVVLKITDMETEQQIVTQNTNQGVLSLTLADNTLQLTLDDIKLVVPVVDEFVAISVTLVDHYVELKAGNATAVHVFEDDINVTPVGGMELGYTLASAKRAAVSSFTGCIIGFTDTLSQLEGEGFRECEEEYESCENNGVKVGSFCQCPSGFEGDLCEMEIKESCKVLKCPGECRETSQGPECICSWPTDGVVCTDTIIVPTFRADSSLTFNGVDIQKQEDSSYTVIIEINPLYPKGFIMMARSSTDPEDFMALYLDEFLYFSARINGEYVSFQHDDKIELGAWSLIKLTINDNTVSLAVNDVVMVEDAPFSDVVLDADYVTFGKIPDDVTDGDLKRVPGFFGEINPLLLGDKVVDIGESEGSNIVSAESRDGAVPYDAACSSDPCGDNVCLNGAEGYICVCSLTRGLECTEPTELISFYGGSQSYAIFNMNYDDVNEFKLRIKPESSNGMLLYGASKYKEGAPSAFFYVALEFGRLVAGVYNGPSRLYTVTLPSTDKVPLDQWSTVTFTLAPQKMYLQLHEGYSKIVKRTKFDIPMEISAKGKLYVGGVRDFSGLEHATEVGRITYSPGESFTGQVTGVSGNGKLLMASLTSVNRATPGGVLSQCAVDPCVGGLCLEADDGEFSCNCENELRDGDLCENIITLEPIQLNLGNVFYHKQLDVGTTLEITFSIQKMKRTLLVLFPPLFNNDEPIFVQISNGELFLGTSPEVGNTITIEEENVATITIKRKQSAVELYYKGSVVTQELSQDVKFDKKWSVGCTSLNGQIYSITADGVVLEPEIGHDVELGYYPPCFDEPCLNGAECVILSGSTFRCDCSEGYTGDYCQEYVDMCATEVRCNATSQCFSVKGTSFYCEPCPSGYRGDSCQEKAVCDLLEPCTFNDLVGICTETEESYTCDCGDDTVRMDCDLTTACSGVECQHNGTCVENDAGFECECDTAFTGMYCDEDVDNCALEDDPCQNSGTCVSVFYTERKYYCLCAVGYLGDNCEVVIDLCTDEPCENGGVCDHVPGEMMFTCSCPEPYFGNTCLQSSCDGNRCDQGECTSVSRARYTCECNSGYTGEFCDVDIDECKAEDACNLQGSCSNSIGDYSCSCFSGFEGGDCEVNIDDCDPDPCHGNGFCMDGYDSYTCLCDPLHKGENCSEESDMCSPDPCQNGASCHNYGVDYFCICIPGFEGTNCSVNTDDCTQHRCENGGECLDEVNGYTCACPEGYTGMFCDTDVDECAESPCLNGGLCSNTQGSYSCICQEYFEGDNCETALSECSNSPCRNGAVCQEVGALGEGAICMCAEGWKGINCTERVAECYTNPCQHNSECLVSDDGHYCKCSYPHTGPNCQDVVSVPYLGTSDAYISYDVSDAGTDLNFRFRSVVPGHFFSALYKSSNFRLDFSISSAHILTLKVQYTSGDPVEVVIGSVFVDKWNEVLLQTDDKNINVELNGEFTTHEIVPQVIKIPTSPYMIRFGKSLHSSETGVSFAGCLYGVDEALSKVRDSVGVTQCRHGNTCIQGNSVCGVGGECSAERECICPLGQGGSFCEQTIERPSPMFSGDGYLTLDGDIDKSWDLKLSGSGTGGVFYGYDEGGKLLASVMISHTELYLVGRISESVILKGFKVWQSLTISATGQNTIIVELQSGERLEVPISRMISSIYVGGSPDSTDNFMGCLTDLEFNREYPSFGEVYNAQECTMSPCEEDPCMNAVMTEREAECVPAGPRQYTCVCGPDYTGTFCQTKWNMQTPMFNEKSYIKFLNPINASSQDFVFKIVFKSTDKSGMIFSTETTDNSIDYLSVGLVNGRVHVSYDLGAGPALLRCRRRVDDGQWHFLHVTLRGRHAVLMVDRWVSEIMSPGFRSVLNVGQHLYLGGSPRSPHSIFKTGLTGCVESVTIHGRPLSMSRSISSANLQYCEDNIPETSIYNFRYRL